MYVPNTHQANLWHAQNHTETHWQHTPFFTPKADGLQCHRLDDFSAPCPASQLVNLSYLH